MQKELRPISKKFSTEATEAQIHTRVNTKDLDWPWINRFPKFRNKTFFSFSNNMNTLK